MSLEPSKNPQLCTNVDFSRKHGKHCKPKEPAKSKKPKGNLRAKTAIALVLLSGLSCGAATLPDEAQDSRQASQQVSLSFPVVTPSNEPTPVPTALPTLVQEKPSVTTTKVEAPPVAGKPAYASEWGTVRIPRLGNGTLEIYEGGSVPEIPEGYNADPSTGCAVIDEKEKCPMTPIINIPAKSGVGTVVGHYPSSAMPGGVGNFNLAGHRGGGNSGPFTYIDMLESGDTAIIENSLGTYTYKFLWRDSNIDPLDHAALKEKVYRSKDKVRGEEVQRALLLTACGLKNGDHLDAGDSNVRVFAYFEYVGFEPKA
jgi:hypothetical protein